MQTPTTSRIPRCSTTYVSWIAAALCFERFCKAGQEAARAAVFVQCPGCATYSDGTLQCADNQHGPICSQCKEGYAVTKQGDCSKCPSFEVGRLGMALVVLAAIIGTCLMVARAEQKRSRSVSIIRIFINYLQVQTSF